MSKLVLQLGEIDRDLDKNGITQLAEQHAQNIVSSGKYDLMRVYVEMKRYEAYLQTLIKQMQDATIQKALEQGQREFKLDRAKLTVTRRRKFDYSGDPYWSELTEEMDRMKDLKKDREGMLKQIVGDFTEMVDEETGELIRIPAPTVETSESIRIQL